MAEAKLDSEMQIYVVQQLAMFEKPEQVRKAVSELFGIEISLNSILNYQITHPKFPKKWQELFEATRKSFLEDVSEIPIANKNYRLRELQKMYDKESQQKMQNTVSMRETLEQAAKESGDAFSNKKLLDIGNKDGQPFKTENTHKLVDDVLKNYGKDEETNRD